MPQIILKRKPSGLKDLARRGAGLVVRPLWAVLPRSLYLGRRPRQLMLALTRVCNINCVFCPYQFARKEDKLHMPEDIFREIVRNIKEVGIKSVMLSPNIGEPLLAPRFLERIRSLRQAGVEWIEVTTNGTWLHRIGFEVMLRDGPDQINISFPGFDKKMYERDTRSPHYDRTRNNVLELLRLNRAMERRKSINLWLWGDLPVEELTRLPDMLEVNHLADDVCVMTEVDDWLGLITQEMLPQGYRLQMGRGKLSRPPCAQLFTLTVHPDGEMQLCSCRNTAGDLDLRIGNIKSMTVAEAHASIPKVLEKWESGDYPACCRSCSMYTDPARGLIGRV